MYGVDGECSASASDDWRCVLFVTLNRIATCFAYVGDSLKSEYLFTRDSLADWRSTLTMLDDCFYGAYQLLDSQQEILGAQVELDRIIVLRKLLRDCQLLLGSDTHTPRQVFDRMIRAIFQITQLITDWCYEMASGPQGHTYRLAREAVDSGGLLQRSAMVRVNQELIKADKAINKGLDDQTCMALRRAYFLFIFIALLCPNEHCTDLQAQITRMHARASEFISRDTLAGDRIRSRLERLKEFSLNSLQSTLHFEQVS